MIHVSRDTRRPRLTLSIDGTDYDVRVDRLESHVVFVLAKLGSKDEYRVNEVGCDCPAFVHSDVGTCKHTASLREVGLLR